jgi:hypothetical protein
MGTDSPLNPDEVLQQLRAGAKTSRTINSLMIIHEICREQHLRGSADFSYSMIGSLSAKKGGPKAQPIRNASGALYRTLIDSWEKFAQVGTRKLPEARGRGLDANVLAMVNDPVARILVHNYICENKKLKYENQVLKVAAKEKVVIDMSGRIQECLSTPTSLKGLLLQQEIFALRNAISPELIRKHGWTINENTGGVNKGALPLFSPGYVSAISKILNLVEDNLLQP